MNWTPIYIGDIFFLAWAYLSTLIKKKQKKKKPLNFSNSRTNENPSWEVKFGLNKVGAISEEIITVENRGTLAVSYEWVVKEPEEKQSLIPLRSKRHEPWFFFNKNSGSIWRQNLREPI